MQFLMDAMLGTDRRIHGPRPGSQSSRPGGSPVMRTNMIDQVRETFAYVYRRKPEVIAFAPGRIEFIGNHTDYNGGPVLGAAIDRGVWVALASRPQGRRFASDQQPGGMEIIEVPSGPPVRQHGGKAWINYPLGILSVLPGFDLPVPGGFDYLALSNLPAGAGLSSSAAIELASALAFLKLQEAGCSLETLAQIGRRAENDFVKVPCGVLDQGVSAFGQAGHLVHIDCKTLSFSRVPLPPGLDFWIFNTHTKHALIDGLYAKRHGECMYATVCLGVRELADVTVEQFEAQQHRLPLNVAMRARHVLAEINRVNEVVSLLKSNDIGAVGRLLTESHRSSQKLFENSAPELDFLVDTLVVLPGVYGARLVGGGFGGAVMALANRFAFAEDVVTTVSARYAERFGSAPDVLKLQSGNGARLQAF